MRMKIFPELGENIRHLIKSFYRVVSTYIIKHNIIKFKYIKRKFQNFPERNMAQINRNQISTRLLNSNTSCNKNIKQYF